MDFKEIMEFNKPYNENNIKSLIEKIKSDNVVPYLGAGISVLSENVYPTWNNFLNSTFEQYVSDSFRPEFDSLNYEEKAEFLSLKMGSITFSNHLIDVFGETHLDRQRADFVDKSIYMLPIIFGKGLLLTTNYDKTVEKIYGLHEKHLTVAHPGHFEALNRSLRDGMLLLFKFHGDISEPKTSIILSKEKYEEAYSNQSLIKALKQVYTSKEILFLGCSLVKDRPIELLCENSMAGMKNYTIISCKTEDVESRRLELEKDYYTQSIIYPDGKHECLRTLLEYIAKKVNPQGYERAIENLCKEKSVKSDTSLIDVWSEDWFVFQNRIQIKNLGDRYSPSLNVELNIKKIFDALSRNDSFYKIFIDKTDKILIELKKIGLNAIDQNMRNLSQYIREFDVDSIMPLSIEDILKEIKTIIKVINEELDDYYERLKCEDSEEKQLRDKIYKLERVYKELYYYANYINSDEVSAINNPYIFLYGEGGIGKSHIIADTIMQRNAEGYISLLFLGQHFKESNDPLINIIKMLELECSSDYFLNRLNSIAKENKKRVIIFIDALNEGNGKEIWKNYLPGMVEKLKKFPGLGLVVSIRTEYAESLFKDNSSLSNQFIKVKHPGFSMVEYDAMKTYFNFYNIQYNDAPFSDQEFRNPLFLRLLCEGHKNDVVDINNISFLDVYRNYLNSLNSKISETCGYTKYVNVIEEVINELVSYKYDTGRGNNFVPLNIAAKIINKIEKEYNMIKPLLDELIANGVLTKNIDYDGEEFIYVTYEKLEDYLYAIKLKKELYEVRVDRFYFKYKGLLRHGDILEALAIVLSENCCYELFDIFEEEKCNFNIISSFCNSLKWRKADTITQKTLDYINDVVLKFEKSFKLFFDVLLSLASKDGHILNAKKTTNYILSFPMPNRDAIFIPLFDNFYHEEGSSMNRLIDWCLSRDYNNDRKVLKSTIQLTAFMLASFLISSNNSLRDRTTKALVNLLIGRIDIVIATLEKYKQIDDPYVIERLYAVAFGCIVSEEQTEEVKKLAIYIYYTFFEEEHIYPNMLIRDYAKSIIEYAKCKVPSDELISLDIQPPYDSEMPEVPTDDEINKYKYDYNSPDFKDYYWSQNAILSSMRVEYNRKGEPGGYGDFGRYTFQSYFSNWKGLNYNDLENIAISKIFKMGYDVEKHGHYDIEIYRMRFGAESKERIGKKYQWIALYELAAQVADSTKMEVYVDDCGNKIETYCPGSYKPNLRNIDPTTALAKANSENQKKIHSQLFEFSSIPHNKWLSNFDDFPSFNKMVELKHDNKDYILLNGWYTWTEDKGLGIEQYQNSQKRLWTQINCYITEDKLYNKITNFLKNKDYFGRWLPEPKYNYNLFNKEYYWSDAYRFYMNSGNEWKEIEEYKMSEGESAAVLVPTVRYVTERKGDFANNDYLFSWYKPCNHLFESLKMRYGKENSILYNSRGEIICFDSKELLGEDIGFFIDKEMFFEFLEKNNYKVFWTVLAEKTIIDWAIRSSYKQPHISGLFTVDKNKKITGNINNFNG